jgi:nitrate reductase cytochrome c-type subunit
VLKQRERERQRQYFFIADNYLYGGCVTFTAHLMHLLGRKWFRRITNRFEKEFREFGYGIRYQNVPPKLLDFAEKPFITDMFKNFHVLERMKRTDITIVIHDATEISKENEPCLKYWNIICIRKALQQYLKEKYNLNPKFIYHPFYPYPIQKNSNYDGNNDYDRNIVDKTDAVSISRTDYGKHTDIILNANKLASSKNKSNNDNSSNTIKIYGPFNPAYIKPFGEEQFKQYYYRIFDRSFEAVSNILNKSKFVIDLTVLPNDGGGTQYTFLEAIHHNAALIINRKWIDTVDSKYCDFKEGYNCFAVSNEKELAEIILNSKNIDTTKIVNNARKLMDRHTKANWHSV